jgi:hypothetical protein
LQQKSTLRKTQGARTTQIQLFAGKPIRPVASSLPAFSSPRESAASAAASAEEVLASALPEGYSAVAAPRSGWVHSGWVRADSALPRVAGSLAEWADWVEPQADGSPVEWADSALLRVAGSPVERAGWAESRADGSPVEWADSALLRVADFPVECADWAEPQVDGSRVEWADSAPLRVADFPVERDDSVEPRADDFPAERVDWVEPRADDFPADWAAADCLVVPPLQDARSEQAD